MPVLAGRYELGATLGRGGYGHVREALDRLTGEIVAVKLLDEERTQGPPRSRREISTLRMLRLPGVVQMLDEGMDDGRAFIVMERVYGTPFPGHATPAPWESIERVTVALLETLGRVHAAGIVHRDLKPANILVESADVPTVLDFGLAAGGQLSRAGERSNFVGTPFYLAPEQLTGEEITPRTDLYSFGVVLHEALCGRLPFEGANPAAAAYARLVHPPPPLDEAGAEVPQHVARAVLRLLSVDPGNRPATAAHARALLLGRPVWEAPADLWTMPSVREVATQVTEALLAGGSVDLSGPPGSGRHHAVQLAMAGCAAQGRRCRTTSPGSRPLESVEALVPAGSLERAGSLEDAAAAIHEHLVAGLTLGDVLVVEEAETLDAWSASLVRDLLDQYPVLRTWDARTMAERTIAAARTRMAMAPLDIDAIRARVLGEDRLFHVPSDVAELLFRRTGGWAGRLAEEMGAWVRAGVARRVGDQLLIDRDGFERVAGSTAHRARRGEPPPRSRSLPARSLQPETSHELLQWISLSAPDADAEVLARAMGEPSWRVQLEVSSLRALGWVLENDRGGLEATDLAPVPAPWTQARRAHCHLSLARAMAPGSEGRLAHLFAAEEEDDARSAHARTLAEECARVAERRAAEGRLASACSLLSEGITVLRRAGDPLLADDELRMLERWAAMALAEYSARAVDRLLYELGRAAASPRRTQLERLLRAALARGGDGARGLALTDEVAPFDRVDLEIARWQMRVLFARKCGIDAEQRTVSEAVAWARTRPEPEAAASAAWWEGLWAYRSGRYLEAAHLHREAAARVPWATSRVIAYTNAASAAMEAFALDEAMELARQAVDEAARCREPFHEARALWLLRAIRYRRGIDDPPDPEFARVAGMIAAPEIEGVVCVGEALRAWRSGALETARALADRASSVLARAQLRPATLAARVLQILCGATSRPEEAAALVAESDALGLPALALQVRAVAGALAPWTLDRSRIAELVAALGETHGGQRYDLLSVPECLQRLAAMGIS